MKDHPTATSRSNSKHRVILRELRERIIRGVYGPGGRIPTRRELMDEFAAGPVTVQRALDHLLRGGVVVSRGAHGTVVSSAPPHLCRFAIVAHRMPGESFYLRSLVEASRQLDGIDQRKMVNYFGLDGHTDVEDYQRLVREVQSRQIAGIVFLNPPFGLEDTPLVTTPGLPRIAISAKPSNTVKAVTYDIQNLLRQMVGHIAKSGRKKVAMIHAADVSETAAHDHEQLFLDEIHRHRGAGLRTQPNWIQFVATHAAWTSGRWVRLMMSLPQRDRPDALIVSDDHLVEQVTMALTAHGVRVPRDLLVVAHANFPTPPRRAVPVTLVGFDAKQMLETCLRLLDQQRRGEEIPSLTSMPALFEEEWQRRRSSSPH